jgi:hypothetical protein
VYLSVASISQQGVLGMTGAFLGTKASTSAGFLLAKCKYNVNEKRQISTYRNNLDLL